MPYKILVQGAGGGGSNNLIREIRKIDLELTILGSNCLKHAVAKSNAEKTFLLPESTDPNYLNALNSLIEKEKIDLIIPNSDREVKIVSELRELIKATIFLPNKKTITICQDKSLFYDFLKQHKIRTPSFSKIDSIENINDAFDLLKDNINDKYWVRPITGSGSCGATWVKNRAQAKRWISLWCELRGFNENQFMISEFLPGRDYNFQSIWNNGKLITATLCERLSYYGGKNRLSGMSSTPEIAISIIDQPCMEFIIELIKLLPGIPHGSYNMDLKGDSQNKMYPTEINIGRFPMIISLHDNLGITKHSEAYIKAAFDISVCKNKINDYKKDILLIRDLDTHPLVIDKKDMPTGDL